MTDKNAVPNDLKDAIAHHLHELGHTEVIPMIGSFTLVVEYVDADGRDSLASIRDAEISKWKELGLLEHRLAITRVEVIEERNQQRRRKNQ